jgi:RhtB (resistance to homoserine/threonine) family protein
MEGFFLNWFLLIIVFGLPLISPGPDFIVAVRHAVLYSRSIGLITALGFMIGVIVHVTYTLLGIATLIGQSVVLFNILKYIGATYLLYIGYKSLRSKGFDQDIELSKRKKAKEITLGKAFIVGFLTNILNPKATLFFLAIFSQFITTETSLTVQITYGATCVIMTGIWFSFVAIILTQQKIKAVFLKFTKYIDRLCGVVLIGLGLKLAMTKGATS